MNKLMTLCLVFLSSAAFAGPFISEGPVIKDPPSQQELADYANSQLDSSCRRVTAKMIKQRAGDGLAFLFHTNCGGEVTYFQIDITLAGVPVSLEQVSQ
jgi:hypothetical protein